MRSKHSRAPRFPNYRRSWRGIGALPNCDREGMIKGAIIAEVASLVGDPSTAMMFSVLVDGRAMTASELALAAGITPQTASMHLGKLTAAGLLAMDRLGWYRHFRLATPNLAEMIEGIVAVVLANTLRSRIPLATSTTNCSSACDDTTTTTPSRS